MCPEIIGWTSSAILLVTLAAQTRKLYRTRCNEGVSRWLFIGELAAAIGFTIYSAMLRNAVYITTKALGVATSIVGIAVYARNRRNRRQGGERISATR